MYILLDSKDLINLVEHEKPCPFSEFARRITERGFVVAYSFANIRELAAPDAAERGASLRIRTYLDTLEGTSHCFLSDVTLLKAEEKSATASYSARKEYEPINPFVSRLDYVFPSFAKPHIKDYHLADIVSDMFKQQPELFRPAAKHVAAFTSALSLDRKCAKTAGSRKIRSDLEEPLAWFLRGESIPRGGAAGLAAWIWESPARCPGMRLLREAGKAMSRNASYMAWGGDIFDLSQLSAIPYVDALTLDRAMVDLYSRVERVLSELSPPFKHGCKVFKNAEAILEWTAPPVPATKSSSQG
jgi:hypothetical protein